VHTNVVDEYVVVNYLDLLENHHFQVDLDHLVVHQFLVSHDCLAGQGHQTDQVCHGHQAVLTGLDLPSFQGFLQK